MKKEQPRVKKKRNWINDETLHWSVYFLGIIRKSSCPLTS
jgi:hypothetical protein